MKKLDFEYFRIFLQCPLFQYPQKMMRLCNISFDFDVLGVWDSVVKTANERTSVYLLAAISEVRSGSFFFVHNRKPLEQTENKRVIFTIKSHETTKVCWSKSPRCTKQFISLLINLHLKIYIIISAKNIDVICWVDLLSSFWFYRSHELPKSIGHRDIVQGLDKLVFL